MNFRIVNGESQRHEDKPLQPEDLAGLNFKPDEDKEIPVYVLNHRNQEHPPRPVNPKLMDDGEAGYRAEVRPAVTHTREIAPGLWMGPETTIAQRAKAIKAHRAAMAQAETEPIRKPTAPISWPTVLFYLACILGLIAGVAGAWMVRR